MTTDKLAAGGQDALEALALKWENERAIDYESNGVTPQGTGFEAALRVCAIELRGVLARRAGEGSQAAPQPFGYAYRYADGIRFDTGGREINGSMPIEVIPLYRAAAAGSGTFAEGIEAAAKVADKLNDPDTVADILPNCASPISVAASARGIAMSIRALAQEKREPAPDKSGEK